MEGKEVYMEFAGNVIPVLQSGDQPRLHFKAFRENRLAFNIRLRDPVRKFCYCCQSQLNAIFLYNRMKRQLEGFFL